LKGFYKTLSRPQTAFPELSDTHVTSRGTKCRGDLVLNACLDCRVGPGGLLAMTIPLCHCEQREAISYLDCFVADAPRNDRKRTLSSQPFFSSPTSFTSCTSLTSVTSSTAAPRHTFPHFPHCRSAAYFSHFFHFLHFLHFSHFPHFPHCRAAAVPPLRLQLSAFLLD
jgi:hypothetical protein